MLLLSRTGHWVVTRPGYPNLTWLQFFAGLLGAILMCPVTVFSRLLRPEIVEFVLFLGCFGPRGAPNRLGHAIADPIFRFSSTSVCKNH